MRGTAGVSNTNMKMTVAWCGGNSNEHDRTGPPALVGTATNTGVAIMTNPSAATFDASWNRYAAAHARCQTLSGATLGRARDQEREAIFQLSSTRADSPKDLDKKLEAIPIIAVRAVPAPDQMAEAMESSSRRKAKITAPAEQM
jgi:type IV secretory pathway VirJ component